ncbi:alanine racemase [Virgibacillus sp. MSJ-26]|uniref:alanine racemase n=1 Tax=Virgibacillus sp. MSJ-26 TaxID=2841522 RepID=UPI001C10237D|nr:alanine racemase [Virgibacillus sp. MSJ-26]MBU5468554.1 alanine racemase [Virgibacillus sp. MSJ-26]
MEDAIIRETWAEINLDHIGYNIEQIKKKLPQKTKIVAVVKADGYGHGSVEVAKKAIESGAEAIAVALLEEALVLRKASIQVPILVLGRVPTKFAPLAAEQDITLTFFQKEWLQELEHGAFKKELKLHMKWDTGMGRIGITTEAELIELLSELRETQNVSLTGVYTHFATADELESMYYFKQKECFENMLEVFEQEWSEPVSIHIGNSAASIRFPENMHNCIRFGISMYGLYPSSGIRENGFISLKQAFSLHSRLAHVKKVPAGRSISYGQTYRAEEDEWIGTVPIGYGDGWIRKLKGFHVLVNGKYMSIVGRICMDMMMIRLDQKYDVGTKVTLIGDQNNSHISMDDVAEHLETINYEIPCMLNERIPRIYISEK